MKLGQFDLSGLEDSVKKFFGDPKNDKWVRYAGLMTAGLAFGYIGAGNVLVLGIGALPAVFVLIALVCKYQLQQEAKEVKLPQGLPPVAGSELPPIAGYESDGPVSKQSVKLFQ